MKKKSIGKYIVQCLMLTSVFSIIVMLIASYALPRNLLIERNQLTKDTAATVMQDTYDSLTDTAEQKLTSMGNLPAFAEKKFNSERAAKYMKITMNGDSKIDDAVFAPRNGVTVSASGNIDGWKASDQDWYRGAMKKKGGIYWGTPA